MSVYRHGSDRRQTSSAVVATDTLSERLTLVGWFVAVASVIYFAAWSAIRGVFLSPDATREMLVYVTVGVALDVALAIYASRVQPDDRRLQDVGGTWLVLRCLIFSVLPIRMDEFLGLVPSTMTVSSLMVAAFPLVVPSTRLRSFVTASLAALTQPLALFVIFEPLPPLDILRTSLLNAAVTVGVSQVANRTVMGLRALANRAREMGAYRLVSRLGFGGSGEVWQAEHRFLARPAAVKTMRPQGGGTTSRQSLRRHFEREAQITARLTSPHTVRLYDFGVADDGSFYYAMELLDGDDLQRLVERNGPLPPERVLQIALDVCDSLAEAHEMGLIHRDLKPANVFQCRSGLREDYVKVLDFGMAELVPRLRVRTSDYPGLLRAAGAPGYVPPEALLGRNVDGRADIYQLGCVLYFLLTGHEVFEHANPRTRALSHLIDRPVSVSTRSPYGVPSEFEAIISRCLEREPSDRFRTVLELEAELREVQAQLHWETSSALELPVHGPGAMDGRRGGVSWVFSRRLGARQDPNRDADALAAEAWTIARDRLGRLVLWLAVLTVAYEIGWVLVHRVEDPALLREVGWILMLSLACDVALVAMVRDRGLRTQVVMNAGLFYAVARTWIIAFSLVRMNDLLGLPAPRITFAMLVVVLFAVFVPARNPRPKIALAAVGQPIAVLAVGGEQAHAALGPSTLSAMMTIAVSWFCIHIAERFQQAVEDARGIGAYELEAVIGRGAMGQVFRGRHRLLARPAAIKMLYPSGGDIAHHGRVWRRFEREARVTARLTSVHTVTLYDYGVNGRGDIFYVMELLEGTDLQELVDEDGPLSPERVVEIGIAICDSLAEAHAMGIVHRDLKPANVFQSKAGLDQQFVKVLDFGLAELIRHLGGSSGRTPQSMPVAGTPGFMAPETLLGERMDGRADLYQLGCVLFFLLTGRLVFPAENAVAMALDHIRTPAPRVSEVASQSVPQGLDDIVDRCLRKEPSERFQNAIALLDALTELRESLPDLPHPPRLPTRPGDESPRRPLH